MQKNRFLPVACALLLLGAGVSARTFAAPPTAGSTLRELEDARPQPDLPQRARPPEAPDVPVSGTPGDAPADASAPGAAVVAEDAIFVREIKTNGVPAHLEAAVREVTQAYENRALTLADIEDANARITALCRAAGYALAQTYLPRQDTRNGLLTINVLIARHGEVRLDNSSLVRDGVLAGATAALARGEPITNAALERALLLISDLHGAALPRASLSKGSASGTSDLTLLIPTEGRLGGYAFLDNHGSRYTGKSRLGAGVDVNSPLGVGDRLSLSAMSTNENLSNGALYYNLPLGADGLRLTLGYSHVNYDLGAEYADLDATGRAKSLSADLSYPLIRSRRENLHVNLTLAARDLRDDIGIFDESLRKKSWAATAGGRYETWGKLFARDLFTQADAGVTFGHLDILDADQRAKNRAGADTLGDFAHLNLGLATHYGVTEKLSLSVSARLQQALGGKNLDASEQFSITGPGGVKAYRETVNGDNGWLAGAELRYSLPQAGSLRHAAGVFADAGRWRYADDDYALKGSGRLTDVGLGYYASFAGFNLKVQLARAVGHYPDELRRDDRTLLFGQLVFAF